MDVLFDWRLCLALVPHLICLSKCGYCTLAIFRAEVNRISQLFQANPDKLLPPLKEIKLLRWQWSVLSLLRSHKIVFWLQLNNMKTDQEQSAKNKYYVFSSELSAHDFILFISNQSVFCVLCNLHQRYNFKRFRI